MDPREQDEQNLVIPEKRLTIDIFCVVLNHGVHHRPAHHGLVVRHPIGRVTCISRTGTALIALSHSIWVC
jgi:hypothetical protein